MRRGLIAFDRFAGLIIAVVLIAAGAAALGWRYDQIPDAGNRLEIAGLTDLPQMSWWPWATGAGGVLLVVLGLTWLARHLPRRGTGQLRLAGSDDTGRLTTDANSAAATAGKVLAQTPGVRDGSGRVVLDRGQLVAELTATLEPGADLDAVRAAAELASSELGQVIGRDDLYHRVELRVARGDKTPTAGRVQ
ncbi:hypothetical protein [Kribbella italica]|uniref:Alkaline shock response membrane anchor protein AmaP n=1 Tax=Kribbella italica TaxID=1540520 RepID=A0A7W9J4W4_9ACTN|nr:hypothetical protein [Kribbella italica]MBB5835686.1 hypothetical protein [Kribbella italica]